LIRYNTTTTTTTTTNNKLFQLLLVLGPGFRGLALSNKKAQLTQGLRATAPSFQDGGYSKMAVSRHLGYYRTGNSAIRSADPENPCLEPHMEWIGCTACEIFAFKL